MILNSILYKRKNAGINDDFVNPTWWDIESIINEDVQAGYSNKYIVLINNSADTTTLSSSTLGGTAWKTSDGEFYTTDNTVHTWDTTKDKPSDEGYSTRWIIVYSNARIAMNLWNATGLTIVYVYAEHSDISGINMRACASLQKIVFPQDYAIYSIGGSAFFGCTQLKSMKLPPTLTTMMGTNGGGSFSGCVSLAGELILPDSLVTVSATGFPFNGAVGITSIYIPNISSTGANLLYGLSSLEVIKIAYNFSVNLYITNSTRYTRDTLRNLILNYQDRTDMTALTLTMGATNLSKLTQEDLELAANKNITLA